MKAILLVVPSVPNELNISNTIRSENKRKNKTFGSVSPVCKARMDSLVFIQSVVLAEINFFTCLSDQENPSNLPNT